MSREIILRAPGDSTPWRLCAGPKGSNTTDLVFYHGGGLTPTTVLTLKANGDITMGAALAASEFAVAGYAIAGRTTSTMAASYPTEVNYTIGAEASNIINVAVDFDSTTDTGTITGAGRRNYYCYLSDTAGGIDVVGTAVTSIANGTNGKIIEQPTAGKTFLVTTTASGPPAAAFDVNIEFTGGAKTVYLIIVMPNAQLQSVGPITFA